MFDQGKTLLCEPDWNSERGNAELLRYAVKNPKGCTAEDVIKRSYEISENHVRKVRDLGYDITGQVINKAIYDSLGIEFSVSPLEAEIIFWNASCNGRIMPGADLMLDKLNEMGIRTAVVSNLCLSSEALRERLNRFLPNNRFEFTLSSGDYMFRKPSRFLFDIAINKSGLDPCEIWYCGDNAAADVIGAAEAGMFPVWYENGTVEKSSPAGANLNFEHLHISEWSELTEILEKL